ncbi:MAG: MogA/MoaB family molybdenum cofactor biosynthesis protein [Candidatus Eiseniibacteriota bacterium]
MSPRRRAPGEVPAAHRAASGGGAWTAAVLTASDTRTSATDESGAVIVELLTAAGLSVAGPRIVLDDQAALTLAIRSALDRGADLVVVTGGTGVAPRDVTPEVVRALCDRELPGFGEVFRALSFSEIGPAACLSRALCGIRGRQAVFALPGSPGACRLALERLILPEWPHLARQLGRRS